jgi:hypothetical protein
MNAKHTEGRLSIERQPTWSPHRMMLKRDGGGTVYWIQERKTGAGRGSSPRWLGFDERDADIMRHIAACWNACEGISTSKLESRDITLMSGVAQRQRDSDRDELLKALRYYEAIRGPVGEPARLALSRLGDK